MTNVNLEVLVRRSELAKDLIDADMVIGNLKIVSYEHYMARMTERYGAEIAEPNCLEDVSTATHVARIVTLDPDNHVLGDDYLVDGVDMYFKVEDDVVISLNELDAPDFCGGTYLGAKEWLAELD